MGASIILSSVLGTLRAKIVLHKCGLLKQPRKAHGTSICFLGSSIMRVRDTGDPDRLEIREHENSCATRGCERTKFVLNRSRTQVVICPKHVEMRLRKHGVRALPARRRFHADA